ncbi:hypothetical protein D3C73_847630 [compost metagenome]
MHHFSGSVGEITDLEPGNGVDNMMEAKRNEQTVRCPENKCTDTAKPNHPGTEITNHILNRTPDHSNQNRQYYSSYRCNDRNKTFTGEEAQPIRHFYIMVFLVEEGSPRSHKDPPKHTHVQLDIIADERHLCRNDLEDTVENLVSNQSGQRRNRITGKSDSNPDGKNQCQIAKDGSGACIQKRCNVAVDEPAGRP